MKYLVEVAPSIERGNAIDEKGGPGPIFGYVHERFKLDAFDVDVTRRRIFLVDDLADASEVAEMM